MTCTKWVYTTLNAVVHRERSRNILLPGAPNIFAQYVRERNKLDGELVLLQFYLIFVNFVNFNPPPIVTINSQSGYISSNFSLEPDQPIPIVFQPFLTIYLGIYATITVNSQQSTVNKPIHQKISFSKFEQAVTKFLWHMLPQNTFDNGLIVVGTKQYKISFSTI